MDRTESDVLRYAAIIAHQMQAPLGAVAMYLSTVLDEYAGPLTLKQRDLISQAYRRCQEAIDSAQRTLTIVRTMQDASASRGRAEAVGAVHQAVARFHAHATEMHITLRLDIEIGKAWVALDEAVVQEILASLITNAIKYTPRHGRIHIGLAPDADHGMILLSVADSGIGIPESDRERVFEPFYRSASATASARQGVGLGLAFVKTVVEAVGGRVTAGGASVGGAEISVWLPAVSLPEPEGEPSSMPNVFRVVIIGGVAAGPKVASKVIRLRPDAEVTVVEKGEFLSYAGCGLPYYVSGVVKDQAELSSTPSGTVRDTVFFQKVKNVHVHNRTEAIEIDRANKRVRVKNSRDGAESWLEYDKLVLATGATPVIPPMPGVKLRNVFKLHGVEDAEGIKALLATGRAHDVVIVGGGLIGVEVTEALVARGCRVTIVEMLPQILAILDWEMAKLVEQHLESHGVKVLTDTRVESIEGTDRVTGVVTTAGRLQADLVVMSVGVRPNVALARAAGIEIGPAQAIRVDSHMRTSDPDIYAAGDCVECLDMLTNQPIFVPLGSTANKQGRVAAMNLCGRQDEFPGILGSTVCKVFDYCVGRTGLTETQARDAGFDVTAVLAPAPDRAHYMPGAKTLLMKLVADSKTRRLLGLQTAGPGSGDKRVDVAAMAIMAGMTVDQLANADLCYAPPYSPAMDNIITAANIARNKLDGIMEGLSPMQVHEKLMRGEDFVFLDVRSPAEVDEVRLPKTTNIPLGALRARLSELPKDKEIIAFCKISLRGYEAALILKAAGFSNVKVLDGGIAMWPYEKVK